MKSKTHFSSPGKKSPHNVGINQHVLNNSIEQKGIHSGYERFQDILEIEPDALIIFDSQDLNFDEANQAALELFGYERDDLIDLTLYDLLLKKGRIKSAINKVLNDNPASHKVPLIYFQKNDGSIFPGELSLTAYSINGNKKLIGVVRDISERLLAEESLKILQERLEDLVKLRTVELAKTNETMQLEISQRKRAEKAHLKTQTALKRNLNFLETLLSAIPNPVFYLDHSGRFSGCNPSFEDLLGVKNVQIKGKMVSDVWPKDLARIYPKEGFENLKDNNHQVYQSKIRDVDGNERDVVLSKGLFQDENEEISGLVGVFTDITKQKKIEEALRESKATARVILNVPTDIAALLDTDGIILDVNATMARKYKKKVNDLIGMCVWDLFPEDIAKQRKSKLDKVKQSGNPVRYEEERDGNWYDTIVHPIKNSRGNVGKIVFQARDITNRKMREQASRIKDFALESSINAIAMLDLKGRITYVNRAFLELWDYKNSREVLRKTGYSFLKSKSGTRQILKTLRQSETWQGEVTAQKSNGSIFYVQLSANVVKGNNGQPVCMMCSFIDITSRKIAEEAIERRLNFEKIISNISSRFIGVYNIDQEINQSLQDVGSFSNASRSYVFMLNENGTLLNNTHEWCAHGVEPQKDNLQDIPCESLPWWMAKLKKGESIHVVEVAKLPAEASAEKEMLESQDIKSLLVLPIKNKNELIGFIGFDNVSETGRWSAEDTSMLKIFSEILGNALDYKKSEEALKYNVQRNQALLEAVPDLMFVLNEQGSFVDYKTTPNGALGLSRGDIIGKSIKEIEFSNKNIKSITNKLTQVFKTGVMQTLEFDFENLSGKRTFEARLTKLNDNEVLANVRDITNDKKLEEEILKTAKLESLGVLAGGIAHDFNNLLTAFLGNISLAKTYIEKNHDAFERLNAAENAAARARDLTRQLLTFSKGGEPIKKIVSVKELVHDSVKFSLSGSNVKCRFKIANNLWPIRADEGQISQVFHNVVINADQAMPNGGIISISCTNENIFDKHEIPLESGKYVKISIKDKGKGIAQEHLANIFDPYFTTKEGGSGLGLATSFSIIRRHQGHIHVKSEIGKCTIFDIYLPAISDKVKLGIKDKKETPKGVGKVLLMDDEYMVREVAGEMLTNLGYHVEFTVDGKEALSKYKIALHSGKPFDLVIMDLTIPGGMGGKEAIKKLIKLDPTAKVIVSSGYYNDPVMSDYQAFGFKDVIAKPYQIEEFSNILKRVLSNDVKKK